MTSTLIYKFELDGVDVVDYVLADSKIELNRSGESGNTAEILLAPTVTAVKTPSVGQEIIISRGTVTSTDNYKFRGEVKQISYDQESNHYVLKCKDKMQQFKHSLFTKSYDINIDAEAGEVSAIFKDIVEDYGFTASVVDSGTGSSDITIEKFISNRKDRLNRLNTLAKILNWFFYYDYDNDYVRFEPKGYVSYGTDLIVGTNVFNIPKWDEDLESVRNKLYVEGASELDTRQENEIGDGTTSTFNFTYTPVSTNLTVDGNLMKQGVAGGSETYDYTIDQDNKTYTFETASIPALGEAIIMTYTAKVPRTVTGKSQESIDLYGLTQEDSFKFDDIQTVEDATTRLSQLLELLAFAPLSTNIFTDEYNIKPGMKVTFSDANNSAYDGEYVVYGVTINYPDPFDVVKIGSEQFNVQDLFNTINERLNSLEGKDSSLGELLRHLIELTATKYLKPKSYRLRKRSIGTAWIVGHPVNGIVGATVGSAGSWSTEQEVNY
jgi:hypothetical protein